MKHEVVIALKNSLIGHNETLNNSNLRLSELSKNEGYCMCLMEVIDEPNFNIPIKQAALIQLKNIVKAKWKPKTPELEMTPNEKNNIKNTLILAMIRCENQHILIKIYREVLTNVIEYEYENWIVLEDLIRRLSAGENLVPVFHCIIAICTNFESGLNEKKQKYFNGFLKNILPAVFETVKNNIKNMELVYLSLKILWKAVHYDIEPGLKVLMNPWMELLFLTITAKDEEMQKNLSEIQNKNTPEFYYYHSKKWATRILMRFVQKHSRVFQTGLISLDNVEYSKFWYETYGIQLCKSIVKNLEHAIPTTKKIRYFELKIIEAILQDQPQLIAEYSKHFQYDILIRYMNQTQEDEMMANNDVIEYFRSHDDLSANYSNVKKAAIDVWKIFMSLESNLNLEISCYTPGPLFEENMQFMYAKLLSQDFSEKELGMFLFCENKTTILRVPTIKVKIQEILLNYVVPELFSPSVLIRVKANEMLYEYGKEITDLEILRKSLEAIFICLTQDKNPLVRIKAAIALSPIISNKDSKQLLQPYIKEILEIYLKLIEQYDLEQLVQALEHFITDFSESISPFAIDLFKYLSGIFIKMFNKDMETLQNDGASSEIELAACSCMGTMAQILKSPLDSQIRSQLEPYVLEICAFLFSQEESSDYFEDLMLLIKVHVLKVDKITKELWFFFQVLIYFVAGIPEELWNKFQNQPLSEKNKKMFLKIREGNKVELLGIVVPVLRNYFGKGYSMIIEKNEGFKINFMNLVFYLVNFVYKKVASNSSGLEGELHFDYCTILLVYFIETFPPEMTKNYVNSVWNYACFNVIKSKTLFLKQITAQLFSVLLWKHPLIFIDILDKNNKLTSIMNNICDIAPRLKESQQRKRVILGICSYFSIIGENLKVFKEFASKLFQILLQMVKRNSRKRIIDHITDEEEKDTALSMENDSMNDDDDKYYDEDDDKFWHEDYNESHASKLLEINELEVFKITMEKLNAFDQQLYAELVRSVEIQTQEVELLLNKAIFLKEK